jgi:hypothetical protein
MRIVTTGPADWLQAYKSQPKALQEPVKMITNVNNIRDIPTT